MSAAVAPPVTEGPGEGATAVAPPQGWRGAHVREFRWQYELVRLLADPVWYGVGVARGDGRAVLTIPGFLAGDMSLRPLRLWLERIGYRPRRSGMAVNVDCADHAVDELERRLLAAYHATGRRVALIGHSRGGHFAKALARRRPELVATVVSMGAGLDDPFAISRATAAMVERARRRVHARDERYESHGCFTRDCVCTFGEHFRATFPGDVPLTSIWTDGDGVVHPPACQVGYSRNVEVRGSHVGLAYNRYAYRIIADTLAAAAR